jgi:hypothetical protein
MSTFNNTLSAFVADRPLEPEEPEEQEAPALSTQVRLSESELKAIKLMIDSSYGLAMDDHERRKARISREEDSWRDAVGLPGGESGLSNYKVPITLALCLAKHAREVEAIFGAKASVKATPVGPTDVKASKRVGLAMSWQFYENMKGMKPLALCMLRRIKHGRSFAFVPWSQKAYNKFSKGTTERIPYKTSPEIIPLGNDDIMLPADVEGCDTLQDASWAMRRYKTTPTEMLLLNNDPDNPSQPGEWYQGIEEHFGDIVKHARTGIRRDSLKDGSRLAIDMAEGVQRDSAASVREYIEVEEWYFRWRLEAATEVQAQPEMTEEEPEAEQPEPAVEPGTFMDADGVRRYMLETDLVVRYIREMGLIVGVQRLDELYPDTPTKRPIMEFALLNDGHYWCMGLIELAGEIEKEMTVLLNQVIEGTGLAIAPPIFYEPTAGELGSRKYEKHDLIPTQNAAGIQQMQIRLDLSWFSMIWLVFQTIYEQLTGVTQQVMGRGLDQPNAPRTLGGQRLIMGAGDIRLALDMRMLGEDMKRLLEWIWDLWRMMGSGQEVYRVAEGDIADFEIGEVENGWAKMSPKEMQGRYDFTLEFADDMQVREGKKQEMLALFQALVTLPFIQNNPVIQYHIATEICDVFGFDFTQFADEPPPPFLPDLPEREWVKVLEGQDIHLHPMDDDMTHIADHEQRIAAMADGPPEDQDRDAMFAMMNHIEEHKQAALAKQQAQMVMQGLRQMMMAAQGGIVGGQQQGNPLAAMLGGGTPMGGGQTAPPMGSV